MELTTALLIIVGCFALSAFFSGSETALLRLSPSDYEGDGATRRGPSAPAIRELMRSTSRLLVTILLGNNLVNILASALATSALITVFGEVGVAYATAAMTVLVLVFAEILPKTYALNNPDRVAVVLAQIGRAHV